MSLFQVGGNLTVDGIDYYLSEAFGEGLYNSCKDVKFGTMNTRAIEFVGGGAKNSKGDPLSNKLDFCYASHNGSC